MSALFGIFNLNGHPVSSQDLARMKQAKALWSVDGFGSFCEGYIALGVSLLYNTPESLSEKSPLKDDSGRVILIASVRLDNRKDLFKALNICPNEQASVTDSSLILKSYQKWGEDCSKYLLGDWAFAVWNATRQELFIARDHYGVTALYYYHDHQRFFFASSLKALLALPELPRQLDPTILVKYSQAFKHDGGTAYKGIRLLTPGQAIIVTKDKLKIWHYWHPREAPEIRFRSEQDYLDAFMELYREAVVCRLRSQGSVGSMLSGGLDSGSISILAAQELSKTGKVLAAFSSIPTCDVIQTTPKGRCGDERSDIEAICAGAENIKLSYVTAEHLSPLIAVERGLAIHDQPHGSGANYGWILNLLETAQQNNIGTILDGWGGNFTISWAGDRNKYLWMLLQTGQLKSFTREINAWRDFNQASLWQIIKTQILKPFLSSNWLYPYQKGMAGQNVNLLNEEARQLILKNHTSELMRVDYEADQASNSGLYEYFRNGHTAKYFELASEFGLEIRQPAMDKRIIEFCLGIPHSQHAREGQERLLVRKAMHGLMPESVLWYKRRGVQSADIVQRIRANETEIKATFHSLEASAFVRYYMNLNYIKNLLQTVLYGNLSPALIRPANTMLKGLSMCLFLQRFENA